MQPLNAKLIRGVPAEPIATAQPKAAVPEIVFLGLPLLIMLDYLGLGSELGILKVTRFSTLLAWSMLVVVLTVQGGRIATSSKQGKLLLGLIALCASSLLYAVVRSYVPQNLRALVDYFGLFVVTACVLDRRSRVTKLAIAGSLVVMILVARNTQILTSSARVGGFVAGSFMGDGNDFAWGVISLMPLPLFLLLGKHGKMTRLLGLVGTVVAIFGVVGTQSRGATLAVVLAGLYYALFLSKRRLVAAVSLVVVFLAVAAFAPDYYLTRVTSTDVQADSSAQGRLKAWSAATQMAIDYPLGVGLGSFNSAYGRYYRPESDGSFAAMRWISAHSIYFKVLGEHGFLGLFLLLAIIVSNFRENGRSLRYAREHPENCAIEDRWPAVLNLGVIGYAVAGAFLGGIGYPHLFLISALAVSCRCMTSEHAQPEEAKKVRAGVRSIVLRTPRPAVQPLARPHARI